MHDMHPMSAHHCVIMTYDVAIGIVASCRPPNITICIPSERDHTTALCPRREDGEDNEVDDKS